MTSGQYTSGNSLTQTGTSGTQQTAGAEQNQYTAPQQALQGTQAGVLSGLLSGTTGIAGNLGYSPQVWQSMLQNFNENVAPQLAAQYGAGSPVIGSQLSQLLLNATAGSSQQAAQTEQSVLGDAQAAAYTPVGSATGTSATSGQNSSSYGSGQTNSSPTASLVSSLANSAGAALSNAGTPPALPSVTLPGGMPTAGTPSLP